MNSKYLVAGLRRRIVLSSLKHEVQPKTLDVDLFIFLKIFVFLIISPKKIGAKNSAVFN